MNPRASRFGLFVLLVLAAIVFLPATALAADQSTFESFYKGSAIIGWTVVALVAIAGGAFIFFTGGAASPVVAGMGTWVGSMMGYSGIAATNAGLALLGGGSVVSGGLGMLGGVSLLNAALLFGTGAVIDYSVGTVIEEYSYSKFVESSKQMTPLPLPKNSSGPASYSEAFKVLKKVNEKELISTEANQSIIREATHVVQTTTDVNPSMSETARSQTLLALLQFSQNQYAQAKKTANVAYGLNRSVNEQGTLVAFIYSSSALSDKKVNFTDSFSKFQWAISAEPDNPMTHILFAVYLDRLMYRLHDGALSPADLNKVYEISKPLPYDKKKSVIQLGLLNRYLIRLFAENQRIGALTGTENKTIKDSRETLTEAQEALKRYRSLISLSRVVASSQKNVLDARLNSKTPNTDWLQGKWVKDWEKNWSEVVSKNINVISKHSAAAKNLEIQIKKLEAYQGQLPQNQIDQTQKETS